MKAPRTQSHPSIRDKSLHLRLLIKLEKIMQKLLLATLALIAAGSSVAQENTTHCSKRARYGNMQAKSNSLSVNQIAETERYNVHYYALDLNMTNTSTALSGTVEIHGTANETLDSVLFELFPSFTVSEIRLDNAPVTYNWNNTAIKVPVNLNTGEAFAIAVDYSGTPPTAATNPLGGSGMTNDSSPTWGNQVTWSLSEPFSAYEWFPCKQSLTDKADSCDVKVTVPSSCMAGSNGVLVNVVDLGAQKRFEWKHRHPIDYYLISVSVAEYVEYNVYANPTGSASPVLIQNFIYNNPQTLPYFQDDIDETADFLELFADLFGPYPFADEKYGHCMAPLSGGMEHQTMTTQGFFERSLTAHELAHQWWGDNVTCGSWADIWVNEGFASYCEYLMLENLYTAGDAATDMQDRHNNIKSQPGGSVWVLDSLNEGSIFSGRLVYDKGAAIIHTMRYLVNDDALFLQALQTYQQNFAEGTAIGLDIKSTVENVTGTDLTDFFEQWYFGEGYPTYSAKYRMSGTDLLIQINHTTSMPSVTPTFTNPIDVRIDRAGVPDTTLRLEITSNSDLFVIPDFQNFNGILGLDYGNWIINSSGSIVMDPELSAQQLSAEEDLLVVYPNPSEGMVTVRNPNMEQLSLKVLDPQGKVILAQEFETSTTVDLSHYASGHYLFELVYNDGQRVVRKLIKK